MLQQILDQIWALGGRKFPAAVSFSCFACSLLDTVATETIKPVMTAVGVYMCSGHLSTEHLSLAEQMKLLHELHAVTSTKLAQELHFYYLPSFAYYLSVFNLPDTHKCSSCQPYLSPLT